MQTTEAPSNLEEQVIAMLQGSPHTDTEIAQALGTTRQKVTKIKTTYLQSGLGDKVKNVLDAVGIGALVKWAADGEDCGCEERRQRLNHIGGLKVQRCLTQFQFEYLDRFFKTWAGVYSPPYETLNALSIIRNHVFSLRYNQPNPRCRACVEGIINPLRKLRNEYENNA